MSTSKINVLQTLQDAHTQGTISQASLNALTSIHDIGVDIQQGLGIQVEQIGASEVILLSIIVDDSGSMHTNADAVRTGFNDLIDTLRKTKQQDNIQVSLRFLNDGVIFPFTPLEHVPALDSSNYSTRGMTPLFRESLTGLGTTMTKLQDFEDNGIQVRSITIIMTDGDDNASGSVTAGEVAHLVKDMLQSEMHIIAGMGFDNGYGTDFVAIFKDMHIEDQWIFTSQSDPTEIRKAFLMVSQSVARASQSSAQFSQTAMGGFGA